MGTVSDDPPKLALRRIRLRFYQAQREAGFRVIHEWHEGCTIFPNSPDNSADMAVIMMERRRRLRHQNIRTIREGRRILGLSPPEPFWGAARNLPGRGGEFDPPFDTWWLREVGLPVPPETVSASEGWYRFGRREAHRYWSRLFRGTQEEP